MHFYTDAELEALLADVESDLVERKETFAGAAPRTVRQAICAFANDLPGHGRPGVVFVGARDDGSPSGLEINDALLLHLAHCKTDGNILPIPTMTVSKRRLAGADVAVVMVAPADSPPVRYQGRIWTRVGPRWSIASAQDERVLNERRRHGDAPFDVAPVRGATLADIDLPRFQYLHLPQAFAAEVLARNDRTVEERLAATKMIVHPDDPTPTVLGILALCPKPARFLPGAYVQFVRFDGEGRADPILDNERVESPLAEAMAEVDRLLRANVRESVQLGRTEVRRATYAVSALQELVRNAVLHRSYEGTSSPVALHWFAEHVEVISPGGPYGQVTPDNFGRPGLVDYRNPNLADAMRVAGLVQRFGVGLAEVRAALHANEQEEPRFEVDAQWVRCVVRVRRDWPGNLPPNRLPPRGL